MNQKRNPITGLAIRLAGVGLVLYWYAEIVAAYFRGGTDAPDLTFVILGGIVLLGGSLFVGIQAYKLYKQEKQAAEEEALQAQEAAAEAADAAEESQI